MKGARDHSPFSCPIDAGVNFETLSIVSARADFRGQCGNALRVSHLLYITLRVRQSLLEIPATLHLVDLIPSDC